jgi:hypothetical protein
MHMARMRWVVLCSIVGLVQLFAGSPSSRPLSTFETRLDLIGPVQSTSASSMSLPQDVSVSGKKSVGLAALYSLLIPGMGELYTGEFGSSGKYFLAAEGVLWLTWGTFDVYGNSVRDDSRAFAVAHASADVSGKDDQFFVDLGNFMNTADYNEKKLRDREVDKLYDPAAGYAWQWDSDASRATFRDRRVSSDNAYNNRKFVIAAVIVNHVASAINAARAAIAHNKEIDSALGDLQFGARVLGGWEQPDGIMLSVAKSF